MWDPLEENWQRGIEALKEFKSSHGHTNVPENYLAARKFRLGRWLINRKRDWRGGVLPEARYRELQELGINWPKR